jgi:hypothetical protein
MTLGRGFWLRNGFRSRRALCGTSFRLRWGLISCRSRFWFWFHEVVNSSDLIGRKRMLLTGVSDDNQGPIIIELVGEGIAREEVGNDFEEIGIRDGHESSSW